MSKIEYIQTRHGKTTPILFIDNDEQQILILELID